MCPFSPSQRLELQRYLDEARRASQELEEEAESLRSSRKKEKEAAKVAAIVVFFSVCPSDQRNAALRHLAALNSCVAPLA